MDFGWNRESIIKNISDIKLYKDMSLEDKNVCIMNYMDMLDVLDSNINISNDSKIDIMINLFQNKMEYRKDYFMSFLPYIEEISSFYNEYKTINNYELSKNVISNDDLLTISHDYFNSYKNKDKIKIFNEIIKNNHNFINISSNDDSKYMGCSYYLPYNKPKYAIYINRKNTISDIITMVHEFEHLFNFFLFNCNTDYDYNELPSEVSTYYLLDYLSLIGINKNELIIARIMEYNRVLYFYYNVYNQYKELKNKNFIKIIYDILKNKDMELLSKYNAYFDASFIKERLSGIVAFNIYTNYSMDDSVNEYYNYLTGINSIYDIAITDTLDVLFESVIKNIKVLKK